LTNSCGADQTAKNTCATATTAADGQPPKTGAQADAFNAAFGIETNFAVVAAVDDQGNIVSGNGNSSGNSSTSMPTTSTSTAQASSIYVSPMVLSALKKLIVLQTSAPSNVTAPDETNLQTFTGALGGITAPAVTTPSNGQFQVDGNSAFKTQPNALNRSWCV
jgi:hypothetical protein